MQSYPKPKLILMDVYETLVDMTEMERSINRLMDSRRGYAFWFELFMQYCFVDNCTVQFHDFNAIARATMKMTGKMFGRTIDDDNINAVLELLRQLPVHEDVQEGLSQLSSADLRIAALTNSPADTVMERMERTGLISYFEAVLSAEEVRKYKPCTDVYTWAAEKVELQVHEILLVSAHGWDIAGGANAGMRTAYVKQSKQMLYPLAPEPDLICKNLVDLAKQIREM